VVYLVWLLVLGMLYPACKKFRELKQKGSNVLLKYL
jgi:hypothetical protein